MCLDPLVDRFCTPRIREETDADRTAFADAEHFDIAFEDRVLKAHALGAGPDVLLVHGWGSRASHLALLARFLSRNGYRVVAFDGPAHGSSRRTDRPDRSNMFEFGRAIACVARTLRQPAAVMGHSFGGTVAAFVMAGLGRFGESQFHAEKLVLINAPVDVAQMIESYSRTTKRVHEQSALIAGLEKAFDFSLSEYSLTASLTTLAAQTLIVHDEHDDDIPVAGALRLHETFPRTRLLLTSGSGHQRILLSREMLRGVKEFLGREKSN